MSVTFEDNSIRIQEKIAEGINAFLDEAGGEVTAKAKRNSRVDTGKTKGSYAYKTQKLTGMAEVHIGSDYENAIWEEYGTGEYALKGNGRKGGWTYRDEKGNFHHTYGKRANRPLLRAFESSKSTIQEGFKRVLNSIGG